ncbi:hypothetical protein WA026_014438 [Henosepilachna vigintioctopunctata]|uniref:Uncharacterized protein n=1 Tax=Henosepilachna vigintioctopunctata TaxID=420089 RepID=A0AAW1UEZ7_9CUCU
MKASRKNVKKPDPFADTLHVRQISTTYTDVNSVDQHKGNDGRKLKNNVNRYPFYGRTDRGPRLNETGLQCFMPETNKQKTMYHDYGKIRIHGQLKKASIGSSIKMISVDMPRFGRGEAVVKSRMDIDTDYNASEEILPYNETSVKQSEGVVKTMPKNVLEEAQKEIDISQNQLHQIHSILKNKKTDEIIEQPKWNPPPIRIKEKRDSKERVVASLSTLNKKLSDMQEKYFSQKKPIFKSIDDIPSKLSTQSSSDFEMVDSNSDNVVQMNDRGEIYRKLGLLEIQENLPVNQNGSLQQFTSAAEENRKNMAVKRRNNSDRHLMLENDYSDELNFIYCSSQDLLGKNIENERNVGVDEAFNRSDLSDEDRKRILEQFYSSQIGKIQDTSYKRKTGNSYRGNLTTKCFDIDQDYPSSISDVLTKDERPSDISMNIPGETFPEKIGSSTDSSYMKIGSDSKGDINEVFCDANTLLEEKYKRIEQIQETLLKEDEKSNMKRRNLKKSPKIMDTSKNELISKNTENLKLVNSKTSNTDYYDCHSKLQNLYVPSGPNKKIFYDNFGRYSSKLEDEYQKYKRETNKTSNMLNIPSSMKETKSTVFDDTDLQESVLKSEYLTKTCILKPSKPLGEKRETEISQKTNEEFFKGVLNMSESQTKTTKNIKNMYSALTKALSNSFYTIAPQN